MIEKSPDAFRTISEVSRMLAVPTHVLRFWETKFSQLRPVKKNGGRRYYRPEDIVLLKAIQNLLHNEGYTIKGAQQVLRNFSKSGTFGNGLAAGNGDAYEASAHANAEGDQDIADHDKIQQARACVEEARQRMARLKSRLVHPY